MFINNNHMFSDSCNNLLNNIGMSQYFYWHDPIIQNTCSLPPLHPSTLHHIFDVLLRTTLLCTTDPKYLNLSTSQTSLLTIYYHTHVCMYILI